jgi:hypothetical protein
MRKELAGTVNKRTAITLEGDNDFRSIQWKLVIFNLVSFYKANPYRIDV